MRVPASRLIRQGMNTSRALMSQQDKIWSRYSQDKVDIGETLAQVLRTLSKALPLGRRHVRRVERAGHLEHLDAGTRGRLLDELREPVGTAGGHDLPRAVAVGGVQLGVFEHALLAWVAKVDDLAGCFVRACHPVDPVHEVRDVAQAPRL